MLRGLPETGPITPTPLNAPIPSHPSLIPSHPSHRTHSKCSTRLSNSPHVLPPPAHAHARCPTHHTPEPASDEKLSRQQSHQGVLPALVTLIFVLIPDGSHLPLPATPATPATSSRTPHTTWLERRSLRALGTRSEAPEGGTARDQMSPPLVDHTASDYHAPRSDPASTSQTPPHPHRPHRLHTPAILRRVGSDDESTAVSRRMGTSA